MSRHSLIERPEMIHWDDRAREILAAPNADDLVEKRQDIAAGFGLVAVYFDAEEIQSQVNKHAIREVQTGRATRAVHVVMLNGGKPYHDDKVTAMERLLPGTKVKVDQIRTTAYDGPNFVGAYVKTDEPENMPTTLQPGDEVVLDDDGLDTGESLIETADFLHEHYGIEDFSADTALTKQPAFIIAGFRETNSLFSTPFGVFGEGYGFDNGGKNRDSRVIGISWNQAPANFERVEHTLATLGDIAIATIDEIVAYNRARA